MTDAVLITDMNMHVRSWNGAAERLYGWSETEVLGRHLLDVVGWAGDQEELVAARVDLDSADRWHGTVDQVTRDGSVMAVRASTSVVRDEMGAALGIVTVNRPVLDEDADPPERRDDGADLRRGLAAGEFEVYYQPVVALGDEHVVTVGALVRWNHPEDGLLGPELRQFPVHALKIDRSFVTGVDHDENSATIVRSILALGGELDLVVVAEGIETQEEADTLKALGCTAGQGYLYGRPVPAADVALDRMRPLRHHALTGGLLFSDSDSDSDSDSASGHVAPGSDELGRALPGAVAVRAAVNEDAILASDAEAISGVLRRLLRIRSVAGAAALLQHTVRDLGGASSWPPRPAPTRCRSMCRWVRGRRCCHAPSCSAWLACRSSGSSRVWPRTPVRPSICSAGRSVSWRGRTSMS